MTTTRADKSDRLLNMSKIFKNTRHHPGLWLMLGLLFLTGRVFSQGNEFLINSTTGNDQRRPAAAMFGNGGFVVVWESVLSHDAIVARLYDNNGTAAGNEFPVNETTTDDRRKPAIALNSNTGEFVVVWESRNQAGTASGLDVAARIYQPDGTAKTGEFLVNQVTGGQQKDVAVAVQPATSNIIFVWAKTDSEYANIVFRRFDPNGLSIGNDINVLAGADSAGFQHHPAVAVDPLSGEFVIVWEHTAVNDSGQIYLRHFNADGTPKGAMRRTSAAGSKWNRNPDITCGGNGDFLIVWDYVDAGSPSQKYVKGRPYTGSTQTPGTEFSVDLFSTPIYTSGEPAVARSSDEHYAVVWEAPDTDNAGIFARYYSANATPLTDRYFVNSTTSGLQTTPDIAVSAAGKTTVAVWDFNGTGDAGGVFGDRTPPRVTAVNSDNDTGDGVVEENEWTKVPVRQLLVTYSEQVLDGLPAKGAENTTNYSLVADPDGTPVPFTINSSLYDPAIMTAVLDVNSGVPLPTGHYRFKVLGSTSVHDRMGNALDGNGDGIAGDDYVLNFIIDPPMVIATVPAAHSHHSTVSTNISATFDNNIVSGLSTGSFAVQAMFSGKITTATLTTSADNKTITLDPAADLKPGEKVHATTTGALLGEQGASALPFVWISRAGVSAGHGFFINSNQEIFLQGSQDIALGDLDKDGDLDAFIACLGNNLVRLNNGSGVFPANLQRIGDAQSYGVALGDLDNDGVLDAFVANGSGAGAANRVWLNNGNGIFTDSGQSLGNADSRDVALGDVNRDGYLDAVVANNNNSANAVYLNDGNGTFTGTGRSLGNANSHGIALGDVDGDGDLDAFVANGSGAGAANRVWLNNGNGIFTDSGQSLGNADSRDVALGDVNGDGHPDAVVANTSNSANTVYLNDGNGIFSDSGRRFGNDNNQGMALGDVVGDGDLDAIFANDGGQRDVVYLNNGTATFTSNEQTIGGAAGQGVALGDLDNDGDLDAFFVNGTNDSSRIYYNDAWDFGDAPYSASPVPPGYPTPLAVDGARHHLISNLLLGTLVDPESNGQPETDALGDDQNRLDDEDGVEFPAPLTNGTTGTVRVTVTNQSGQQAYLSGWVDWNDDKDWDDAGEKVIDNAGLAEGVHDLNIQVPAVVAGDGPFARFRLSTQQNLSVTGAAPDGEVEDYRIENFIVDSDQDGMTDNLEGSGDRDNDSVPDSLDYDPTGYFYDEADGRIIAGGLIDVTGPGNITLHEDGSSGYYRFTTDGTAGTYSMTIVQIPSGYALSSACPILPGPFDPTGSLENPVVLGNGEDGSTGYLTAFNCTPFYNQFDLEPNDPFIINNNFPLQREQPIAVTLKQFTAKVQKGVVNLQWSTESEIRNAGFNLYRRPEGESVEIRINETMVPGQGSVQQGHDYRFTDRPEESGNYLYQLESVGINGLYTRHRPVKIAYTALPQSFALHQNFPNPFNASTTIRYDVPKDAHITLAVYDVHGRKVADLVSARVPAGAHSVVWGKQDNYGHFFPSGVYFCRLQSGTYNGLLKMILLK